MKTPLIILLILTLFSSVSAAPHKRSGAKTTASSSQPKPNIVFIFTDDQSYEAIHAHGNSEIITPHMDRLVHGGTSFINAYNMGSWSGAVCVASRTMINTGVSVWNAQKIWRKLENHASERKFWSQQMEDAGYETYMTGKWHVKIKPEEVFNHVRNERAGMPKQSDARYNRVFEPGNTDWLPWDPKHGGFWEGGKHWSEVLTDDALTFIEQAKGSNKPFFMYLAFNAPHDPRQAPKEYIDMYPLENITLPESYLDQYPHAEAIGHINKGKNGKRTILRDERLAPFPRTRYSAKVNLQEYYAIVTHTDTQVGRILDALEKLGRMDNTYIFFTSDHGLAVGNHGFQGKQCMYEHSVKPPLLVVGPDIPKNKRSAAQVYLQDIMATTLELAGIEKPAYVEFNSLLPYIESKDTKGAYEVIYGAYLGKQRMINDGTFKLILYPDAPAIRLYNIEKDPKELNDLAHNPEHKALIQKLFKKLQEEQEQWGDSLDLNASFPELG